MEINVVQRSVGIHLNKVIMNAHQIHKKEIHFTLFLHRT